MWFIRVHMLDGWMDADGSEAYTYHIVSCPKHFLPYVRPGPPFTFTFPSERMMDGFLWKGSLVCFLLFLLVTSWALHYVDLRSWPRPPQPTFSFPTFPFPPHYY